MPWHGMHGMASGPDQRSAAWWPPSCFTWCPSAPSQAVYTDLEPFYDDVATSPKCYRAPAELAKNQSSALASKLDQTRTRHVAVRCAGRHQPGDKGDQNTPVRKIECMQEVRKVYEFRKG